MRKGWQATRVGNVCKVIAGQSPKGTAYNDFGDGLPFYQGKKHFGEMYIKEPSTWTREVTKEAERGDILMSVRAPVGPVNFAVEKACIGRGLAAIRPGEKTDAMYLFYWFLFKQNEIKGNEGAVFASINKNQIENIELLLPPIPEQKRIVAILDEAFAGIDTTIANTEKNLANARELFESYLNSVFTSTPEHWSENKLSDICSVKHGFAFKSQFFAEEGDYIVLTPGSFWESGGFRNQGKKTKYYIGEIPSGYVLEKGDFLIAMTEQAAGLLGSSLMVPESDKYLHNQRLGLVRVDQGIEWHNDFFFHQFNTHGFRAAVQSTASGAKVRHTSPKKLGNIIVKFPRNTEEQAEVADKLNELLSECRRLEFIYQQKLAALAELKQSLLHQAFSGELTAKAPDEVEAALA